MIPLRALQLTREAGAVVAARKIEVAGGALEWPRRQRTAQQGEG